MAEEPVDQDQAEETKPPPLFDIKVALGGYIGAGKSTVLNALLLGCHQVLRCRHESIDARYLLFPSLDGRKNDPAIQTSESIIEEETKVDNAILRNSSRKIILR
jgi:50S ribosomal subunit-associated GTPase HflX